MDTHQYMMARFFFAGATLAAGSQAASAAAGERAGRNWTRETVQRPGRAEKGAGRTSTFQHGDDRSESMVVILLHVLLGWRQAGL